MSIVFSVLIALVIAGFSILYFSREEVKQAKGFANKAKAFISINKKQALIIVLAILFEAITFIIGIYAYNAEFFMTLRWQVAIGIMVPIAAIDLKKQIIPNFLLLGGLALTVILLSMQVISAPDFIFNILTTAFIGSIVAGGIFFIASLFVKDGIGAGDIKLFLTLGLLLSLRGIFNVLLYSMVISALFSIVLLIVRKKKVKDVLPLAPFAIIGVILSIAFGV